MEQGFVAEGFSGGATTATAEKIAADAIARARHTSAHVPVRAGSSAKHAVSKSAHNTSDASGIARVQLTSQSQRTMEHRFEGLRSIINTVGMIDVAALAGGWVLRNVGAKKIGSILGGWKGIHEEASIFRLPSAMARRVGELAEETGQQALKSSALAKSEALATKAVAWESSFANFLKPLTETVKKLTQGETMQRVVAATPQVVKSAGAVFGRMSVLGKLFTVSAALGLVASGFRTRAAKKESSAMMSVLAEDLGGNTSGQLYQAISKARLGETKSLALKFGADAASAAADAVMWGSASAMSMKSIAALTGSQMLTMLISADPLLGGYQALKLQAAGKADLSAEQRTEALLSLMAHLPSIAQHGGQYNRLARTMAQEMVSKDMKPEAMVQLLNDEKSFNSFAAEVKAKFEAKAKPAEATAPAVSKAEATYHAAPKPAAVALAAGAAHQGNLTAAHAKAVS